MLTRRHVMGALAASAAAPAAASGLLPAESIARHSANPLDALVGRTLILGFLGAEADAPGADAIEADLAAGRIGGVLFLRHNARTRQGVEGLARRFREAAPEAWLAIDQEGGVVQRLNADMGYTRIPRASVLAEGGLDAARPLLATAAQELSEAGFNLNLAPIADLYDPENDAIGQYGRAFSAEPAGTADWCAAFIEAFEAEGIACAIKHFPGHGRSRGDSHDGYVDITGTWTFEEAAPFGRLMRMDRAHLIMGAHLVNRRLDPDGLPVTLSRRVLHGLLREVMGYEGAVITDDLDMGAIRHHYTREQALTGALAAGNDLILISNSANPDPDLARKAVDWTGAALARGTLTVQRLAEANARIDALRGHVAARA
ncbi:glycoside hydrolase family 3 protein [Alkalicaulis satelles]|uniref:beta-N-acetylhexosaminidase n=1 Tax=Alkalicaulis satelles TaxID=2609175 RepID=A0A5M6ZG73_9PROT|nr:glycoside hydrolase family 3 N-terminal domain-containing protein [Alkalicaulis satelles]KAA5803719.1 glycoside hydrolase family 3 protein [Alkalicaulis satelles]